MSKIHDKYGREIGSQIYKDSKKIENINLGQNTSLMLNNDAKSLLFVLSRYKFVAKLLNNKESILEIDCSEGVGARILLQHVKQYNGIDKNVNKIRAARALNKNINAKFGTFDIMKEKYDNGHYDAVFSLDSLEHIHSDFENIYIENSIKNLNKHGVLILGSPTLESQIYASEASKAGHINCKSGNEMVKLVSDYFYNSFYFSMNDEVVHTGYSKMAHYHFVVGCEKK